MVAEPQNTVILSLILGLGLQDGEGGLVSKQGAGELGRDSRNPGAATTY